MASCRTQGGGISVSETANAKQHISMQLDMVNCFTLNSGKIAEKIC